MTTFDERRPRAIPVERLRAGDHACLATSDREVQWKVLTAYTWAGLTQNEKVLLILDDDDLGDDEAVARLDGGNGRVAAARDSGQLSIGRTSSCYLQDGHFDMQRQVTNFAGETERAEREGWSRLRLAGDMSWVLKAGLTNDEVMDYEAAVEPLFADGRYTAICWYDRRRFSDYLVAATCEIHPLQVLERLDAIETTPSASGARITNSAEFPPREDFTEALHAALKQQTRSGPVRFELDLTDVSFMEAHSAGQLISFAASLPADSKVIVDCGPMLEVALRGLNADAVPQLELRITEES